jgi:transposase
MGYERKRSIAFGDAKGDVRLFDEVLYKQRSLVERFSIKLKNFRRMATRYDDELVANLMDFLPLVAIASLSDTPIKSSRHPCFW